MVVAPYAVVGPYVKSYWVAWPLGLTVPLSTAVVLPTLVAAPVAIAGEPAADAMPATDAAMTVVRTNTCKMRLIQCLLADSCAFYTAAPVGSCARSGHRARTR